MLNKQKVNGHLGLVLLQDIGNPSKEPVLVGFGVQIISPITEVQLEWWIRYDVVKFLLCGPVLVGGLQNGVALDHIRNGVDQVVESG